ncbi:hypothetical protein NP233_g8991 [Leucocoprinus birnbaumii]|uniref:Major facilitator superfamily (MFS) profile domain-containing protein n=1 Tax=Leucocoprinus birnbaumii TaxID=56174 RepID=A0AAD5VL65_9AGAR|nr:hypothetical protein NP233_g8991 [Leucocoprinus birnbaumii]
MTSIKSESPVASKEDDYENAVSSGDISKGPPETDISSVRRAVLLTIFCLALFVDAFMTSAIVICLDSIGIDFNQPASITQWALTAYNLTFGSFLLLAGRISDIYQRNLFAAAGTLGLCLGFVLGGIIVQFATWRWVFWVVPIITVPLSVLSMLIKPGNRARETKDTKKMDFPGVFALTVGWGTPRVLAPLIIAVFMMAGFFFWQNRLHEERALIPSTTWFIPNFTVLTLVSFCTQIYMTGPILVLSEYWPTAYDWDALTIGLHVLPIGLTATIVCVILPRWILQLPPRIALICANVMCGCFSILLVFASSRDRYWGYTFPSFVLITVGSSAAYMISNVGIVTSVPPDSAGVAAAIFNAAQQVGGAINVAIISTILVQVQNHHPYPSYKGPSSAMWFIVALGLFEVAMVVIFFKPQKQAVRAENDIKE